MIRKALSALLLATAVAACGTTVPLAQQAAVPGSGLDGSNGLTTPQGPGSTPTQADTGQLPASDVGTSSQVPSGSAATARPGTSTPLDLPGTTTPQGPTGGARKPVEVGIVIFPDVNSFAAQFGGTADFGDQKAEVEAAVNWVNARGGLSGHRIKPVFFDVALTSSESYDSMEQRICASFTQDHKVVAGIIVGANVGDVLASCLNAKKVLYINNGYYFRDPSSWTRYPYRYSLGEVVASKIARAMGSEVLARGFVKKGDTLGILTMELPGAINASNQVLKPMLTAAGVKHVEYTIPKPTSTAAIGGSVAVVQSAQLRMASAGVKNVLFLCPGCMQFFQQNAEGQAYYPRYIFSTMDLPMSIAGEEKARSYGSSLAVGWVPDRDTGMHPDTGALRDNVTRKLCTEIEKPTGNLKGDLAVSYSMLYCDAILELRAAALLNPISPVTGTVLGTGMSRFGTSFQSAVTFGSEITTNKHDGVTSYKTMRWSTACSCMVYDSALRRFS